MLMPDDIRSAFEKAGFKTQDKAPQPQGQAPQSRRENRTPPPRTQGPAAQATPSRHFVLEENYASQAERIITGLQQDRVMDYRNFTTSKIRNILGMVSEIYNDVMMEKSEELTPELQSRIEYMKVRLVYECGREPRVVQPFVNKAGLLELLGNIGGSRRRFIEFARYMEALVAYHRFHGGRD